MLPGYAGQGRLCTTQSHVCFLLKIQDLFKSSIPLISWFDSTEGGIVFAATVPGFGHKPFIHSCTSLSARKLRSLNTQEEPPAILAAFLNTKS